MPGRVDVLLHGTSVSTTVGVGVVLGAASMPAPVIAYSPPVPSASIQPGVDYQVGVEPFVATGLTLTTVTPSMAIPGTSLTSDSQGNILVNVANQTLVGLFLPTGYIRVTAANCTVDRCLVYGYDFKTSDPTTWNAGGFSSGLVDGNNVGATNLLVKDTTCIAQYPQGVWDGFRGRNMTLRRCKARYTTDCCGIYNNTTNGGTGVKDLPCVVLVDGCDFDLMTYVCPDPQHSGDANPPGNLGHSHNDCIQIQQSGLVATGASVEVRYSTLNGYLDATKDDTVLRDNTGTAGGAVPAKNSANGYNIHYPEFQANSGVQVTQGVGPVEGLNFHHNWGGGGGQWFNTGNAQGSYANFGTVAQNKVDKSRGQSLSIGQTISIPKASGGGVVATGVTTTPNNTFIEDGSTITVSRY